MNPASACSTLLPLRSVHAAEGAPVQNPPLWMAWLLQSLQSRLASPSLSPRLVCSAVTFAKPCFPAVLLVGPHPVLNLSSLYELRRGVERKDARVQGVYLGSVSFFVLVVDVELAQVRGVRVLEGLVGVGKPVIGFAIELQVGMVAVRAFA